VNHGNPRPEPAVLSELLDTHAPFGPAPLCPEISVFNARSLVGVWEAAERAAGRVLPAPFWAYPWAAGVALARVILDDPSIVRGRAVLDVGAGGGVASLAAACAGAARVVANDVDDWALSTTRLAASRQGLYVETLRADLTQEPARSDEFDVVLCGDLLYEQQEAAGQRALLQHAAARGALVLAGDAGRTYFTPAGMTLVREIEMAVPQDLEGVTVRTARVYRVAGL
jgi:predicted nicotinamide N-methyase